MADGADIAARLARLDAQVAELRRMLAEAHGLVEAARPALSPLRVKRLIKDGMEAFYAGKRENPHPAGSQEAELWQYGHDLSADSWQEMKGEPPPTRG